MPTPGICRICARRSSCAKRARHRAEHAGRAGRGERAGARGALQNIAAARLQLHEPVIDLDLHCESLPFDVARLDRSTLRAVGRRCENGARDRIRCFPIPAVCNASVAAALFRHVHAEREYAAAPRGVNESRVRLPRQQRLHFGERRHRGRSAGARHRDAGDGAAEADRLERRQPARERRGEAAVEGIARSGRLHHRPGLEGRDERRAVLRVEQRARLAERDQRRPDPFRKKRVARLPRSRRSSPARRSGAPPRSRSA